MKLADYLYQNQLTPGDLRRLLGAKSRSTVMRYITGERQPAASIMEQIRELTGGKVTPLDFHDPSPPRCVRIVMDLRGRPHQVFPWTLIDHRRSKRCANDERGHHSPASTPRRRPMSVCGGLPALDHIDRWPSPPLREAMRVLGARVKTAKRGGFLLDGRLTDTRGVVAAANAWLRANDRQTIPYPGVEPLE